MRSSASPADRPLRILHIIVHLSAGGAELMMKRLILEHRNDPAFEHAVVSLRGLGSVGPDLQNAGIDVVALGLDTPRQLPGCLIALVRLIRNYRPDVTQTWMYHADLIGGIAARVAGNERVVWNVRIAQIAPELGIARATRWIMKACARLSHRLPRKIVYVAEAARRVHEAQGYDPAKAVVIRNGYAIPSLKPDDRGGLRGELGLADDVPLVGSAGRYNAQKNHRGFIAACGLIAQRHSAAHFVMFGAGVDHDDPDLMRWIADTGHAYRFHLMGERRDFTSLLPDLDLFCLHSLSEGFPNVVAEAMAAGVPCAVTDVGDAAMLVDDTGWVVPPADDAALAAALSAALRLDDTTRGDYGSRARNRIERQFSMSVIMREYERLYREVAGGRLNAPAQQP